MRYTQKLLNLWYKLVYFLIGSWFINIHEIDTEAKELLLCVSNNNQWHYFYCEEIKYDMKFKRWFIPDRFLRIYRYSSDCIITQKQAYSQQEQKVLQSSKLIVYFPDIKFFLFNKSNRKRNLLNAYIDLLIREIKTA